MVDPNRTHDQIIACVWLVEDRIESIDIVHRMLNREYSYTESEHEDEIEDVYNVHRAVRRITEILVRDFDQPDRFDRILNKHVMYHRNHRY